MVVGGQHAHHCSAMTASSCAHEWISECRPMLMQSSMPQTSIGVGTMRNRVVIELSPRLRRLWNGMR
jgi:hypothetical protein